MTNLLTKTSDMYGNSSWNLPQNWQTSSTPFMITALHNFAVSRQESVPGIDKLFSITKEAKK
jgi:hypothetical protein